MTSTCLHIHNHIYICCIYIYLCVRAHAVPIYQVNSSKLTIHEGIGPHSHLPLPGAQGILVSVLNWLSKWTWKNMISPETIWNIWRGGFILVHWKNVFVLWYEIVIQNDLPLHLAQPGCHPARELSKMLLSSVSSVFLQLKIKSSVPSHWLPPKTCTIHPLIRSEKRTFPKWYRSMPARYISIYSQAKIETWQS